MTNKTPNPLRRVFFMGAHMAKILLNHNATTNVYTYWHDDPDGRIQGVIETQQTGLEHIADYCKEVREANKFQGFGEGVHYKIPAAMAGQLMREGKLFDETYMKQWVKEHPEYSLRGGQKYFKGGL